MRKIICLLAGALLFASCQNSGSKLLMDVTEVDYLDKSEFEMEGREIAVEAIGIDDIMFCDSFLVAFTEDPQGLFKVYDPETGKETASFGYLGRAKNEFTYPQFLNYVQYRREGKTIIPIVDSRHLFVELDLTNSISSGSAVVEKTELYLHDGLDEGSFSILDNDLSKLFLASVATHDYETDEWNVPTFSIINNGETREIPVFSEMTEATDEGYYIATYSGLLYKHPARNLYAYTLESRDYILYFDLDNDRRFAIHQKGASTFDDKYPKYDYEYGRMTFTNSTPTNDFIITNYCGGSFLQEGKEDGNYYTEFVLFDWEGRYLCGIKVKLNICRGAYDEENHILYGLDRVTEKLYEFDFNPIVDYIKKNH